MEPIIIIPARMASQRLPRKPLQLIHGDPMIVHVWRRAIEANVGEVVVACDDEAVARVIKDLGGQAVLTDPDLPSGSDRIWAALEHIDPREKYDIVINMQGDLPDLPPKLLQKVLKPLQNDNVDIGTLGIPFDNDEDRQDPNQVKIILSQSDHKSSGRALYFTRANAPYGAEQAYYHIGIYAYRRPVLAKYISLPVSNLERVEKLEQLRALEAGMRIDVELVDQKPVGVDTAEDLERARKSLDPVRIREN
jgi:3-deoxy-manno-octulosonate cytidylyltransferase (CMP-KDO synthetase)